MFLVQSLWKKIVGRIRTKQIKRIGKEILDLHKDSLSKNFEENKKSVQEFSNVETKKLRNMIAGFITKKMKTMTE